jgi:Flp pilus assembly protein TadG
MNRKTFLERYLKANNVSMSCDRSETDMGTNRYLIAQTKAAPRRGQALVEFALIAVLFFTMLLGMIQFGIYQSTTNTLWNLSREGARFATVSSPDDTAIINRVKAVAPSNIDTNKLTVQIFPPGTRTSGQPVEVALTYDMSSKMIIPFIGKLFNRNRTIPAPTGGPRTTCITVTGYNYFTSSTMRVE